MQGRKIEKGSPEWEKFFETLEATGSVTRAAGVAGIARWTAYRLVKENSEFAHAFKVAKVDSDEARLDDLEDSLFERAKKGPKLRVYGDPIPVVDKETGGPKRDSEGNVVYRIPKLGTTRGKPDTVAAMFILKARRRAVYGDRMELTKKQAMEKRDIYEGMIQLHIQKAVEKSKGKVRPTRREAMGSLRFFVSDIFEVMGEEEDVA
jgi:hypothetical protein